MLLVIYFDSFRINLVKRLKENNIKYDIVKYKNLENYLQTHPVPTKVIITGSKKRILRENDFPILENLMKKNVKIIGICFGFQYLAFKTGGKLVEGANFNGRRTEEGLYFNHHDRVVHLSKPWKIISQVEDFINIAATDKWIGFQFHPEKDPAHFNHYVLPFIK
jgi:GMP synthase-like glutamine amidotransferase